MQKTNSESNDPFQKGMKAFQKGEPKQSNPYHPTLDMDKFKSWCFGYFHAQQQANK